MLDCLYYLMGYLYYFNGLYIKNRRFYVGCIVKWGGKIKKVVFWDAKAKFFNTFDVNARKCLL